MLYGLTVLVVCPMAPPTPQGALFKVRHLRLPQLLLLCVLLLAISMSMLLLCYSLRQLFVLLWLALRLSSLLGAICACVASLPHDASGSFAFLSAFCVDVRAFILCVVCVSFRSVFLIPVFALECTILQEV